MARASVRLRIEGLVQGVGFRAWTMRQAMALGVSGWVRNRRDGSVEVHAAGEAGSVEALVAACHDGPVAAQVRRVISSPAADDGTSEFTERATL